MTRARSKKPKQSGLSLKAYARRRGVTPKAVRKHRDSGRIPVGEDGKFDPKAADAAWQENVRQPVGGRGRGQARRSATLSDSIARKERALADLRELELQQKSAELVEISAVRRSVLAAVGGARDMLLGLADRLAPVLVGRTDEREVHDLLTDEMRRACDEVASIRFPA
ncbi:MAG: hypothetical protein JSR67_03715 [Proteobacteria bacterium]|nr:hypothetical protein [Pseudomonadota bacterium]